MTQVTELIESVDSVPDETSGGLESCLSLWTQVMKFIELADSAPDETSCDLASGLSLSNPIMELTDLVPDDTSGQNMTKHMWLKQ